MWQFFTERGKKVVQLAHREALRLGHDIIGTEHILLGLIAEGEGVAVQVIESLGIGLEEMKLRIEEAVGTRPSKLRPVDLPLSPRAKRVLDLAISEARNMRVNYVGTEHVLLGLLAEGEGVAFQVMNSYGLDLETVRQELNKFLSNSEKENENLLKGHSSVRIAGRSKTPNLDQLGIDLTEMSGKRELDPVIGRDKEIKRLIQILSRRTKNNPVLIGDPGVGKTAIVEGLAQKISAGDIPEPLKGKRVVQLNMGNLVAGTKYRGEFEERMRKLVKEMKESREVILFIDEIHTIVGAGGAEGAVDAANILKPSLARGEFQVVGATTLDEYRKHIEKDAALERRFQPVTVEEPSVENTIKILAGLRDRYEAHHRVKITDEALTYAAKLSERYISDRFLPDKSIDLMDEAAARARLETMEVPADLKELEKQLDDICKEKEAAVDSQAFEKAADLRDQERQLAERLERKRKDWHTQRDLEEPVVLASDIALIVSEWTGIPVLQLTELESKRLLRMEDEIHKRLIGQEEAVSAVSRAIRRTRSGLKDPKRPIGSFLFLGPTGVGKTELARALAEFLFGSEESIIRVDMSEYMERHEAAKLIGAPPGYVGYEEGGKLTESIRRRPYSVILFDEVEKAHPDVFNILLQIMEDGHLTDGQGHLVDFRNSVVIMTSNIGAKDIFRTKALGFSNSKEEDLDWQKVSSGIMEAVKKTFRPEFINRIDEIVIFKSLCREEMLRIVDIMIGEVRSRLSDNQIVLEASIAAKELILEKGYDPKYGARPLRRIIQQLVEDKLADMILDGSLKENSRVMIGTQDGQLDFITIRNDIE